MLKGTDDMGVAIADTMNNIYYDIIILNESTLETLGQFNKKLKDLPGEIIEFQMILRCFFLVS